MASLVEQIYMQSQGGSAQGQGFGQFFAQGLQGGLQLGGQMQEQQRINMAERQLTAELALQPLKQTMLRQEADLRAAQLAGVLENREATVKNEAAFQELTSFVGQALASEHPEDAEAYIWDAVSRNKGLWRHAGMKDLIIDARASLAGKMALQQARNSGFTPGFGEATNPVTGERTPFFRTSPNSAQIVKDDMEKPMSTLGKLLADRNTALTRGDTEAVANFDAEIKARQSKDGFSISTNPDGTVTVTQGSAAKIPTAMVTKSEEALSGAVNAARLGSTLINKLRPEDIGVLGRGGEIVVDEGLAQLIPEAANLKRVNARTLLRMYRNDFTRALKFDSQLSNEERKRIEDMLPSDSAKESLPAAIEKIKTATRAVAERARFSAQRAGRPIPNELLLPAELMEKVAKGEITQEMAIELAKTSPFRDDFDALIKR